MTRSRAFLALFLLAACADTIEPTPGGDDDVDAGPLPSRVVNTDHGDGSTTTQVDATRDTDWVYFDFETRAEVTAADASWDLAFRRFHIMVDGGVSGAGDVQIAVLPGADFGAMAAAPSIGWITDEADGADEDLEPDLAFLRGDGWYAYDTTTHVLTARDQVHAVRSVERGYYKVKLTSYYDRAGTSGFVSFRWAPVEPPAGSGALTVDASNAQAWTYVDVEHGVVAIADPATSNAWDLAFSRTAIRTNGGTSGAAHGGARAAPEGASFEAIAGATTLGYVRDAMLPVPGPPGSGTSSGNAALGAWYDYDSTTHAVTSKRLPYLVRTATGDYAKLRIESYASGVFTLSLVPVDRDVTVVTHTVAATDAAAWVHLDLRAGATVTVDSPATSAAWDVAFSRTRVATNSGTSGGGGGGAAATTATTLAAVTSSAGEYAVDAMLPVPGPPGSGEYSGNPVLGDWYDYDPTTHAVTPKDRVFLVRTADGGFAKLEITGYAGGTFTLELAYAGAGRTDF